MRRWSHGHSMGAGAIVGLSFAPHLWLVFVIGGALGWFGRDAYSAVKSGAKLAAHRLAR